MDDLIRRSDALKLFEDEERYGYIDEQDVRSIPAVDAVEVRHGYWSLAFDEEENVYKCSECDEYWLLNHGMPYENNMNYCPRCGARMDGCREDGDA